MLVRSKPESKLITALFFCNSIVGSVGCDLPPLGNNIVFLQTLEYSSAGGH
jgi:hypothetical protein